jgi:hypothetical protein
MINFALYVIVVPEQILLGSIWRTLMGLYLKISIFPNSFCNIYRPHLKTMLQLAMKFYS